jgi:hypothetical protein
MTIQTDINVAHITLCKAAGKAAGVHYLAAARLQSAIDAVRGANVVFGKSVATCPYKQALRNAITGARSLSDAARDNLLSRVMAAIQSKSGEYVARKDTPLVIATTPTPTRRIPSCCDLPFASTTLVLTRYWNYHFNIR